MTRTLTITVYKHENRRAPPSVAVLVVFLACVVTKWQLIRIKLCPYGHNVYMVIRALHFLCVYAKLHGLNFSFS